MIGSGIIRRGVVYDNHLLVRPIDCERAFDRSPDEVAVVVIGDDDRKLNISLSGPIVEFVWQRHIAP
jgi:hypothetical protein